MGADDMNGQKNNRRAFLLSMLKASGQIMVAQAAIYSINLVDGGLRAGAKTSCPGITPQYITGDCFNHNNDAIASCLCSTRTAHSVGCSMATCVNTSHAGGSGCGSYYKIFRCD